MNLKITLLLAGFIFAFVGPARASGDAVVVELFTSQGCAVCNPANQFLTDLADEKDVLALTWTVDYWDYLGWKDTLAAKSHTSRQEAYNAELAKKSVYTPQIVVNGRRAVNGTQKLKVLETIGKSSNGNELSINVSFLGAGEKFRARLSGDAKNEGTNVYLIWYRSQIEVPIARGENADRKIAFANAVVDFKRISAWNGGTLEIPIELSEGAKLKADGVAILIQDGEGGPIFGAASTALDIP